MSDVIYLEYQSSVIIKYLNNVQTQNKQYK